MKTASTPLFKSLRTLIASLPARRRTQLVLLLGLMLVGALAEVLSLGATLLGNQPTHHIDEGLKVAMDWYVQHLMQQGKA